MKTGPRSLSLIIIISLKLSWISMLGLYRRSQGKVIAKMTITLSKERKDRNPLPYSRTLPGSVSGPKPTTTKSRALDITYQANLNPSKTLAKNLLNPTPPLKPNPTTRNLSN